MQAFCNTRSDFHMEKTAPPPLHLLIFVFFDRPLHPLSYLDPPAY